ncbi:PEP-CTERM sorting domain-containing protein [Cerasicoccus fimbriatus]|uniref:PEP-CTERM sorting domain-containing protein n=1 Tax=Cerasicoccus fimbriatus TaxID=3014554 RepID=UPI0022B2E558|nr:PEP-CTERM sorting domain-containing protein [Cerasicoccus sp. TK19100]
MQIPTLRSLRFVPLTVAGLALSTSAAFGVAFTTFIGPDGGNWNDPANWDNGVPDANDEISLGGFQVVVTDTQAYKDFDTGAPDTGGSIVINSGGSLTNDGGHHAAWGLSSITINSGGAFINDPATEGGVARLRVPTTVAAGGTLVGFQQLQSTINVSGLYQPYNSASANVIAVTSTFNLLSGGELQFDVFGNNDSESFSVASATTDLSIIGSTIRLVGQGGYTPGVNDTFNLFDEVGGTVNVISDASNVIMDGVIAWDTTLWESDGILTVAAVPEPTTYAMFAAMGALGVALLRRRK